MQTDSKIFVAGHRGLVGAAIVRALADEGYQQVLTRSRGELDLLDVAAVQAFFEEQQPEFVFDAAAKVGGIQANSQFPADFIRENTLIQMNVINAAYRVGVRKLLFLGSSCIYPKLALQPIKEEYLLTGPLEPTNEWYAIAKICGIKTCQAYRKQYGFNSISLMPTNLYGPGDNFNLQSSHVIPALIRKFHEARVAGGSHVEIWGSGKPRREFLHVDDLANACLFLMRNYESGEIINVGTGADVSIAELAQIIKEVTGYEGETIFNTSKPDGTPRKLLDVSRLEEFGWRHQIGLRKGIEQTYQWFINNQADFRG